MNLQELKRLSEACEANSPSPWKESESNAMRIACADGSEHIGAVYGDDMRYIAACDPATVLGLIAEVERLTAEIQDAGVALRQYQRDVETARQRTDEVIVYYDTKIAHLTDALDPEKREVAWRLNVTATLQRENELLTAALSAMADTATVYRLRNDAAMNAAARGDLQGVLDALGGEG